MAPTFGHCEPHLRVTQIVCTVVDYYPISGERYVVKKVETRKEKLQRLSKQKMFASWSLYNQKEEKVFEIKQFCKPRHQMKFIIGRT